MTASRMGSEVGGVRVIVSQKQAGSHVDRRRGPRDAVSACFSHTGGPHRRARSAGGAAGVRAGDVRMTASRTGLEVGGVHMTVSQKQAGPHPDRCRGPQGAVSACFSHAGGLSRRARAAGGAA